MVDINVERRGPRIWPWIIGLIILVVLIWIIAEIVEWRGTSTGESVEVAPEAPTLGASLTRSHDVLAFWHR